MKKKLITAIVLLCTTIFAQKNIHNIQQNLGGQAKLEEFNGFGCSGEIPHLN
jgi:hypothetical protein